MLSLMEIDALSSDDFAQKMRDPEFAAAANRLFDEAAARREGRTIVIEETPEGAAPAIVPTPAPTPVVPVVPVADVVIPEQPEQRYSFQPVDENGKPMGGMQVIKYRTQEELTTKLVEQNQSILRELRKRTREQALGIEEAVPDTAERFQNVPEFKNRELTAEERFQIARELVNPETTAQATDKLIESVFGQKPAVVASTLNEVQRSLVQGRAVDNYIEFVNSGTGYQDCPENREIVTRWMGKRNLAPTVANFKYAQSTLSGAGLLFEAPAVQQVVPPTPVPQAPVETVEPETIVPNPQAQAVAPPGLGTSQPPQAKRQSRVPSGLNESISSAAPTDNVPAGGNSLTLRDIDRMTSDEYRQRLRDPEFKKAVDKLEAEAAHKRAVRQGAAV